MNNPTRTRRLLIIIPTAAIVLAAATMAVYFFFVLKPVKLLPADGVTITLTNPKNNKEIAQTNSPKTIRVRSGSYTINYSAGEDYQPITRTITIKGSSTFNSPALSYSEAKLSSLLSDEQPAIQAVLAAYIDNISEYDINNAALYVRGEWYGALLVPKSWYEPTLLKNFGNYVPNPNNTLDAVRVIAKKDNGQWQVVAGPSVVFNTEDSPDIPEEVIVAVNRFELSQ